MLLPLLPLLLSASSPGDSRSEVTINVTASAGKAVLHTLRDGFAGVTLDWWPPDGGCTNCGGGWRNASVTHVDLQSARLRALASALSPGVLRLGGTDDKIVQYWLPDTDGSPTEPPPACRPSSTATNLCLNASRWAEINEFVEVSGLRLVFGLSLNATQNQRLIEHSHRNNYSSIFAYEIPEEFTPGWHGYPGSDGRWSGYNESFECGWDCYIAMYHDVSATLHRLYAAMPQQRPLLIGPCEGMVGWNAPNHSVFSDFTSTWIRKVVTATAGALDALVYHSYNNNGLASKESATFFLNQTLDQAEAYLAEAQRASPALPLILGEGAFHNGGCSVGGCDSFGSSLYYLDALGKLSELGHEAFFRQSFVGGNYALADTDTLEPRPDYYTAVLFQRLMGTRVLPVRVSSVDPDLHMYAHCARIGGSAAAERPGTPAWEVNVGEGDITFAFLNRSPHKSFDVTLLADLEADSGRPPSPINSATSAGAGAGVVSRSEFHLTSANRSDVFGSHVLLNGALLTMESWAMLPRLAPQVVRGNAPLHVGSQTVGFAILHGAGAKVCLPT